METTDSTNKIAIEIGFKRFYTSPNITKLGSITDLTKGGGGSKFDSGNTAGQQNPNPDPD